MKKIISLLLTVLLITGLCVPSMAEETEISVLLDGEYVAFDVAPTIIDGRTMVPVRAIFEAMGATVDWQQETKTAVSVKGDTEIVLKIDDTTLYKNGEAITLDVPAQLIDNRTLVPVRAISEAYGCHVNWNDWTKTVLITSDLNETVVATVNGEAITAAYFNFVLAQAESFAMQNAGVQPEQLNSAWNTSIGAMTFGEYVSALALEECVYAKANAQKAKEAGISLTEEEQQAISVVIDTQFTMYENYAEQLKAAGTTLEAIKEILMDNTYADKYYSAVFDESAMSDAEVIQYLDENYVKAKHILFSTVNNQTGEPLSEEEIAAKKKLAEETLIKIRNGSSFDALMEQHGEDPGAASNPDGYLFTRGEMVEEFETAAFNLAVGEVSGIVESRFGFHIIKRVSNGEYTESDKNAVISQFVQQPVIERMQQNMTTSQVTTNNNIFSNMVPVAVE